MLVVVFNMLIHILFSNSVIVLLFILFISNKNALCETASNSNKYSKSHSDGDSPEKQTYLQETETSRF